MIAIGPIIILIGSEIKVKNAIKIDVKQVAPKDILRFPFDC
jgi:hypothetical protein